MIPTLEMIDAGWKAGLGLNKLQVERILVAALAVARAPTVTDDMVNAADSVLSRSRAGIPDETIRMAITAALSAQPMAQSTLLDADIDDHEQPRYTTKRLHEEMKRARAQGRQEVIDELRGTCVAVLPRSAFQVRDQVEKHTGDYHAKGEVRGIFAMKNGAIRYVVEHPAEGGGSFCHLYSEKNLRNVGHEHTPDLAAESEEMRDVKAAALEAAATHLDEKAFGYEEDAQDVRLSSDDRRFAGAVAVRLRGSAAAVRSMKEPSQ